MTSKISLRDLRKKAEAATHLTQYPDKWTPIDPATVLALLDQIENVVMALRIIKTGVFEEIPSHEIATKALKELREVICE